MCHKTVEPPSGKRRNIIIRNIYKLAKVSTHELCCSLQSCFIISGYDIMEI